MGTFVGGGRHCNRAARDDVGNDLMSGVTGEDHIWSFGVVREHPTDFFAGAETYYAADKGVDMWNLNKKNKNLRNQVPIPRKVSYCRVGT